MTGKDLLEIVGVIGSALVLAVPIGLYVAYVYAGRARFLGPVERIIYGVMGESPDRTQSWGRYLTALLLFNAVGIAVLCGILMGQGFLPLNPEHRPGVSFVLAIHIAVSFVTNTNWQAYAGEVLLSPFSQMVGLTVQHFLSAATGMAVAVALTRSFVLKEQSGIGNFYADSVRGVLYILLPMAFVFALLLIALGVPDTWGHRVDIMTLSGTPQTIALGPVASQIAIKILGSNGGGYFNANAAHPFENPTALSNFFQAIALVLLPAAMVIAFGRLTGKMREAVALLITMALLLVVSLGLALMAEPVAMMEGKEQRIGSVMTTTWTILTTATANGSTNGVIESLEPLTVLLALFNMMVGEVIFGGVGCGLYGMMIYVILAVFIAGLMIGRAPDYLGKKIETDEIKWAMIAQILIPITLLGLTTMALFVPEGQAAVADRGPHGLTVMLYAFTSAVANNGSGLGSIKSDGNFMAISLAIAMMIGRFGMIAVVLAIAGSLASKKITPPSAGSLPTHTPLFILFLMGIIVMLGGLTYFPALALGPVAEHFSMISTMLKTGMIHG